jgi:hypothetical protein
LRRLLCIVRNRPEQPIEGLEPIASNKTQSSLEKHLVKTGTSTGAEKKYFNINISYRQNSDDI